MKSMRNPCAWLGAVAIASGGAVAGELTPATQVAGGLLDAQPMVVVGSATGDPPITPNDVINGNSLLSPFAGVVSIFASDVSMSGGLGTGVAISPRHILTAAHVIDWTGGLRLTSGGLAVTGDGLVDALPAMSSVYLNAGPLTELAIDRFDIHPDWNGFLNLIAPASENAPSLNDDLAIITLSADLPAGVPIYALSTEPFLFHTPIIMVGYGMTGHGDEGFDGAASINIKRYGYNVATEWDQDDEGTDAVEIFQFDFDGPTLETDVDGALRDPDKAFPTLGNDMEATIGPGDSGGPSFIHVDLDSDGLVSADELTLFGINTFSGPGVEDSPLFGSIAGGMIVSSYLDFVTGVIPEPATGGIVIGMILLLGQRRRQSH